MPARVLFLCTGNSCRSQMAEGWSRHYWPEDIEAYSAGIEKKGLNPDAVAVMREAGVDISTQESQTMDDLPTRDFDLVITVCSHADKHCPTLPGTTVLHHGFDDPPELARQATTREAALAIYRRVRDEIEAFVRETLPERLRANPK